VVRAEAEKVEKLEEASPSAEGRTQLGLVEPTRVVTKPVFATDRSAAEPTATATPTAAVPKVSPPSRAEQKMKELGLRGGLDGSLRGKPAVTIGLWFSTLRGHLLEPKLGELLRCDSEWRAVLASGLDPVRDLEGVLIVGTSLDRPEQMTVAVEHRLPEERLRAVMDGWVTRSGPNGAWLERDVARIRLGRSERVVFSQRHHPGTFFVAGRTGWEALHLARQPLGVPRALSRGLSLVLRNPRAALAPTGLSLPESIEELRLEIYPNPDQSVDLKLELDRSPEARNQGGAERIARGIEEFFSDLWAATETLALLTGARDTSGSAVKGQRVPAPKLVLREREGVLTGMARLSEGQVTRTLGLVSSLFCRKKRATPLPSANLEPGRPTAVSSPRSSAAAEAGPGPGQPLVEEPPLR